VYNLFHDTFARYVSEDKFIDSIFTTDPQADWKYSTIKNRVIESGDPDVIIPSLLCNAAHTYYQIHNFIKNLDNVMLDEFGVMDDSNMNGYTKMRPINSLLSIDTDEKMKDWLSFNSSSIKTKSIKRDTELATLEGFE
jgi:hypothetical protein